MKSLWLRLVMFTGILWCAFPCQSLAQEARELVNTDARALLRDDAMGCVLPLPNGWQEETDPQAVDALLIRIASVFTVDGTIPGLKQVRAATSGEGGSLVIFALDYASFGFDARAVSNLAKDPLPVTAGLANTLQTSYIQRFPQSIMIDNDLEDEYCILNLRTVLAERSEQELTVHRRIKMMLTAGGVVVLMTQYDGAINFPLDSAIAAIVRETQILAPKALQTLNPPFEPSFLDYVLVALSVLIVIVLIGKLRRFLR